MSHIEYQEGYKYQLAKVYVIDTPISGYAGESSYIKLEDNGRLTIRKGYAWDGASGPTIDTKDSMRPSLVHDAFYQLMREGIVPLTERGAVDSLFHQHLVEDRMNTLRAWAWYNAVKGFAEESALKESKRPILIAP